MSEFKKALLWTAVPIGVLSILSAAVAPVWVKAHAGAFAYVWVAIAFGFVAAFIALIMFIIKRKKRVAAGILAGIGIAIATAGVSCFAIYSQLL